jgi:hypothetical protein
MRHSLRAITSVLLVLVGCHTALAETTERRWWPFGKQEDTTPTTTTPSYTPSPATALPPSTAITPVGPETVGPKSAATQDAPTAPLPAIPPRTVAKDSDRPPIVESPFAGVQWPKLKLPDWSPTKPRAQVDASRAPADLPRNAWVDKPAEPPRPTPTQRMSNGANRVAQSTRNAWRKTVDFVTPGGPDPRRPPRIAERDSQPSVWQRMFGASEPEPEGPQTIPQWMAQDRVDP